MIGAGRSGEIGKRAALKMRCPQGPAGSSPASGTISFRALVGSRPREVRGMTTATRSPLQTALCARLGIRSPICQAEALLRRLNAAEPR